jgi:hypothetical protein
VYVRRQSDNSSEKLKQAIKIYEAAISRICAQILMAIQTGLGFDIDLKLEIFMMKTFRSQTN